MTPESLRATRTVRALRGRQTTAALRHRSAAMVIGGGGRWAKRLLQTAVATGAVGALLPVLVPSATPQIKRMLLMSRGSTRPGTAASATSRPGTAGSGAPGTPGAAATPGATPARKSLFGSGGMASELKKTAQAAEEEEKKKAAAWQESKEYKSKQTKKPK